VAALRFAHFGTRRDEVAVTKFAACANRLPAARSACLRRLKSALPL